MLFRQTVIKIHPIIFIFQQRRADAEDRLRHQNEVDALHRQTVPAQTRLVELIEEATCLLQNAEGVPVHYGQLAEQLRQETAKADLITATAPSEDTTVSTLKNTIVAASEAERMLSERAANWEEFITARTEADNELDNLRQPLEIVLAKPKRPVEEVQDDLTSVQTAHHTSDVLDDKIKNLQRLSELLDPLESAYADVRFFDVDAEQTQKQYDDLLNELMTELEDEKVLRDSTTHVQQEIAALEAMLNSSPTAENIKSIEEHQLPAVIAQLELLKSKASEAETARKHVQANSTSLAALVDRSSKLEEDLNKAKASLEKESEEQLVLVLTLKLTQLEATPLEAVDDATIEELASEISLLPADQQNEYRSKIEKVQAARKIHAEQSDQGEKELEKTEVELKSLFSPAPSETKKSKKSKGKKQKSTEEQTASVSIPSLEEKLSQIKNLSNKLDEISAKPISPESRSRLQEAQQKLNELNTETTDILATKLAEVAELERLAARLTECETSISQAETDASRLPDSVEEIRQFQTNMTGIDTLLDSVNNVPADLEDKQKQLTERHSALQTQIETKLKEVIDTQEKIANLLATSNEEKKKIDEIAEHLSHAQPITDVESDLNQLQNIVANMNNIDDALLEKNPQIARAINDIKQTAKVRTA